jgi:RHS repeat-associated protein
MSHQKFLNMIKHFNIIRVIALFMLVFAVTTVQASTVPGSLPGDVSVNNTGSASYSIPIDVVPGTGGMQPGLALVYNSGGGNGLLGVGWSISGLSTISRGPTMLIRDGISDGMDFDGNDQYYLDGQRLIQIGSGSNFREYRTEIESFSRVRAYVSTGSSLPADGSPFSPGYWTVETKSGLIMWYGARSHTQAYADSVLLFQGAKKVSWSLARTADTLGNYYDVYYTPQGASNVSYVSKINYTGNTSTGLAPYASVEFSYEDRTDVSIGYAFGSKIIAEKRLSAISIKYGSAVVRSYGCSYLEDGQGPSQDTSRSLLRSVQLSSGPDQLNKTTFSYTNSPDLSLYVNATYTGRSWDDEWTSVQHITIDIDGDGIPEFLKVENKTDDDQALVAYHVNSDGTLSLYSCIYAGSTSTKSAVSESFLPDDNSIIYSLFGDSTPEAFSNMSKRLLSMYPVDVDYDGDCDVVVVCTGYLVNNTNDDVHGRYRFIKILRNENGALRVNGPVQYIRKNADPRGDTDDYEVGLDSKFLQLHNGRFQFGDFDGDMQMELLEICRESEPQNNDFSILNTVVVRLWNYNHQTGNFDVGSFGTSGVASGSAQILNFELPSGVDIDDFQTSVGDMNGDGRSDIFVFYNNNGTGSVRVYGMPETGTSAITLYSADSICDWTDTVSFSVVDFNCDGLSDLIYRYTIDTTRGEERTSLFCSTGITYESLGVLNNPASRNWIEGDPQNGGTVTAVHSVSYYTRNNSSNRLLYVDVNMDGQVDLVAYHKVNVTTSDIITSGPNSGQTTSQTSPTSIDIFINNGNGFASPIHTELPSLTLDDCEVVPVMVTAQAAPELLLAYRSGSTDLSKYQLIEMHGNLSSDITPPDLLTKVTNGNGAVTEILYAPLTRQGTDAIYTKGRGAQFPVVDLIAPMYVVSWVGMDYGTDEVVASGERKLYWSSYKYAAARVDVMGRGFLGFGAFASYNWDTGVIKVDFVEQAFPNTGMVKRTETYYAPKAITNPQGQSIGTGAGSSVRLVDRVTESLACDQVVYAIAAPANKQSYQPIGTLFPMITKSVEERFELGAADGVGPYLTTITKTWFDEQNLNEEPVLSFPGSMATNGNVSVQTTNLFTLNPDSYATFGFESYTATINALKSTTQGGIFPCKITFGNVSKVSANFDGEGTQTIVNTYTDDPLGWKLGRLTQSTVSTTGGSQAKGSRSSCFYYYSGSVPTVIGSTVGYSSLIANACGAPSGFPNSGLLYAEVADCDDDAHRLITFHIRDSYGNIVKTVEEGNFGVRSGGTSSDVFSHAYRTVINHTTWDSTHRLPTISENELGHSESKTYDPVTCAVLSQVGPNGLTTTFEYDHFGHMIRSVEPGGIVRTVAYTSIDEIISPSGAPSGVAALSQKAILKVETDTLLAATGQSIAPKKVEYFSRLGAKLRSTSEGMTSDQILASDILYDKYGRAVANTAPYFLQNAPGGSALSDVSFSTASNILWSKMEYDSLGRVWRATTPDGAVTTTTYCGRVLQTKVETSDGLIRYMTKALDAKGQDIMTWNADNVPKVLSSAFTLNDLKGVLSSPSVTFAYDSHGNPTTTTLKSGTVVSIAYDNFGNKTSMVDPDMGTWHYYYDALGRVRSQVDGSGCVTWMDYDNMGRLVRRVTNADSSTLFQISYWSYYDANASGVHDDNAWIGALQREVLLNVGAGSRTSSDIPSSISSALVQNQLGHYYDSLGREYLTLELIDDPTDQGRDLGPRWYYTYVSFDECGRVVTSTQFWRPKGLEGNMSYKPYIWQSYGLRYTYNENSVMTQIQDTQGRVWWSDPIYDHAGRLVSVRKGNVCQRHTFDLYDGTLTGIKTGLTWSDTSLQNLTYEFDGLGNLTRRTDTYSGTRTETFGYDTVNRLTHQNGVQIATYGIDGNIASRRRTPHNDSELVAYSYNSASHPHAVRNAFDHEMDYDANGRMIERENPDGSDWTFNWTSFGQLSTVANGQKCSQFAYGIGQGRIVHTKLDGWSTATKSGYAREKRLYAGGFEQFFENTASAGATPQWSAAKTRIYINAPDGVCGVFEHDPDATTATDACHASLLLTDYLGSIDLAVNFSSGIVLTIENRAQKFSYDPWGGRRNPTNWLAADTSTTSSLTGVTDMGFTGHETLDELGLVHMNGRIYDPLLGRFLSADPTVQFPGFPDSYNRFSYVLNNPLRYTDPSGYNIGGFFKQNWKTIVTIVIAIVAAVFLGPLVAAMFGMAEGGIGAVMVAGFIGGFAGGFTGAALNGAGLGSAIGAGLQAGARGAAIAAVCYGVISQVMSWINGGELANPDMACTPAENAADSTVGQSVGATGAANPQFANGAASDSFVEIAASTPQAAETATEAASEFLSPGDTIPEVIFPATHTTEGATWFNGVFDGVAGQDILALPPFEVIYWEYNLHYALNVMGFFPILGSIPSAIEARQYAKEGAYLAATYSLACAVPIGGNFLRGAKSSIKITRAGLRHVMDRHTINGLAEFVKRSKFYVGENIETLIKGAEKVKPVIQNNGNFRRIYDVGRKIGIDRTTGKPTSIMTVITSPDGSLVTAFPGNP